MKNLIIIISLLISVTTLDAQTYYLQKSQSEFQWIGKAALNAYTQRGTLMAREGSINIENKKITQGIIIIDMTTLSAENNDLAKHLRNKDFFEVKKYKTAKFVLTQPLIIKEGTLLAKGMITIKGITKPYTMPVEIINVEGGYILNGKATIDRTVFGIYYNSLGYFDQLKQNAISNTFSFKFQVEFK